MNKIISWAAVILWMGLIFYLSHQPAVQSSQLSTAITEAIAEKVEKFNPHTVLDKSRLSHLVRKHAHFLIYLVLGFLVAHAIKLSKRWAVWISVLYAVSDEGHQLFVPGRGAQFTDVLIDSAGAMVGISLYIFMIKVLKRNRLLDLISKQTTRQFRQKG